MQSAQLLRSPGRRSGQLRNPGLVALPLRVVVGSKDIQDHLVTLVHDTALLEGPQNAAKEQRFGLLLHELNPYVRHLDFDAASLQ